MNDDGKLFAGFAILEPSAGETHAAIEKTRVAIMVAATKTTNRKQYPKRRRLSLRVAVAATLLVSASLSWLTFTNDRLAMAEVIHQLIQANSLRCVSEGMAPNEKWFKIREFIYDREHGFVDQTYERNFVIRKEIDDGKHHWIQRQNNEVVTRGEGRDVARQLEKLLNPLGTDKKFQPDPSKDQVIDGIQCRYFFAIYDGNEQLTPQRVLLWIDDSNQLRRVMYEARIESKWVIAGRTNVEYDIDIDTSMFKPDFGNDAKVVDLNHLFDNMFPFDEAVHSEEHSGYILAVHELKRLSDFEYYLLISFRPTEETRRKLALSPGESPGSLRGGMRYEQKELPGTSQSEVALPLASAIADGVQVAAYLCNLSGIDAERIERARPQLVLFAHSRLWKEVKAISQVTLDVPLPDEKTPLQDVVRSTYDMIAMLESVPMEELYLVDEQEERVFVDREHFGGGYSETQREHRPRPSEVSFDTFFEHVQTSPSRQKKQITFVEQE